MSGYQQETPEETRRRLALGSVTTAPMMQTLDNRRSDRRSLSSSRVLGILAIVIGFVILTVVMVFMILLGDAGGGDDGEIGASAHASSSTP
jgi:hypothetical protein